VLPAAALALVFTLAFSAGVLLHSNTNAGRRRVARETGALVSRLLVAGLLIERIDVLSPGRLAVSRATLFDRLGKPVLQADGLEVRFGAVALVRGIFGDAGVRIALPDVRAERVSVWLTLDPVQGGLTLETAFDTRAPKGPGPSKPIAVSLPHIAVKQALVATDLPGIERARGTVTDLAAGLDVSPAGLSLTLKSGDARILHLLPEVIAGRLDAELRLPGKTRAELDARAGAAPVVAEVRWQGQTLELGARSSELTPAAMQRLVPGWPLVLPLRASAQAKGEPAALQAGVEGSAGATRLTGHGSLRLVPEVRSDLNVHVEALDLRLFDAEAPATALDVDARVALALADGAVTAGVNGTLAKLAVAGHAVPPLAVTLSYGRDRLTGTATVLDPALASELTFELSPARELSFEASAKELELGALARFGVQAEGRARAHAKGTLAGGQLAAELDATVNEGRFAEIRAANVSVRARVHGPVARAGELQIDLRADGTKLEAAGVKLAQFRATANGTVERAAVTLAGATPGGVTLDASAGLAPGAGPTLRDVRLESSHGAARLRVTAPRVVVEPDGVRVEELALHAGRGELTGSVVARTSGTVVKLVANELELAAVLGALGLPAQGIAGRIDGRIELDERAHERQGHAHVELRDGAFPPLEPVAGTLDLDFEHADVRVVAALRAADVGSVELDGAVRLERPLLAPNALHELTGEVALSLPAVNLARFSELWLADSGTVLAGRATAAVHFAKREPHAVPNISYELTTHELAVASAGAKGAGGPGVRLDIDSKGDLFTPHGSRIAFQLVDAQGPWIAANLEHALGPDAFAQGDLAALHRAALDAPLRARITAYRRPLKMLGVRGSSALEGTAAGVIELTGSAREPELDATASVVGAKLRPDSDEEQLALALRYSAARETYTLEAHAGEAGHELDAECAGRFGWVTRGLGKDWSAKGRARLTGVGLARLARLLDVPVEGDVSAELAFDVEPTRIDATGGLELVGLSLDRRPLGNGKGRIAVANGRAEASFRVSNGRSTLELLGRAGIVSLERGLAVDTAQNGMVRATAEDFDLGPFGLLARGTATRVGGRLNGRAEIDWGASTAGKAATTLRANATVRDATVSLVAGGGLIQKVEAQALADGDGPLRLTFSGAARSRQPNVEGTAELRFAGPRFKRLDAKVALDGFPLLYDGVLMGRASTTPNAPKLAVAIIAGESGQTVEVEVPAITVKLPESSDKQLIALEDDPAIAVADTAIDPEVERAAANGPGTTTLKVRLGDRVVVKRDALEVPVRATLSMAPDGKLTGTLRLQQGGVVPALGQTFRIARGTVTFKNQDVKAGSLAIETSTRAADGTLIELSVSGTVGAPLVTFRSDPPRPKNEIIALLLGIQADSTSTSDGEQLGRTAMALAMNRLVEGSVLSALQFGAGETSEGEAVSSVSMRVGSKVWLEGRTVKGSNTSVNPDERVSGVVDWRFAPSFSLRTQLGDISGVELRWSLRY